MPRSKAERGNVFIPVPRPAYNAVRAFAETVGADFQIVLIKAIQQHIDEHEFDGEDKSRFEKKLDHYEAEDEG